MTGPSYRTALATLGLSQLAAGRWLGVSNKTAQRYATTGPSGAAARAVGLAVALVQAERWTITADDSSGDWLGTCAEFDRDGFWVRASDLTRALDLAAK